MPDSLNERLFAGRDPRNAETAITPAEAPPDLAVAYREQALLVRRLCEAGGRRPVGYKIGATSLRAQQFLGVREPFAGRVLAGGLYSSPARLPAGHLRFRLVEPEYAFTLARSLPARARAYGVAEVSEAIGTLHPAIEVVCSAYGAERWLKVGGRALVADNGAHGALVLGEGRRDWRHIDMARERVELRIDGKLAGTGDGTAALGHPLKALAWLATDLARRGQGLAAGEVVTTGVVTPFFLLDAGQVAVAQFGPLGACRVEFVN